MVFADIQIQGVLGILGLQAAPFRACLVVLGNVDGELGVVCFVAAAVVQLDLLAALPGLVEVAGEVHAVADVVDQVTRVGLVELVLGAGVALLEALCNQGRRWLLSGGSRWRWRRCRRRGGDLRVAIENGRVERATRLATGCERLERLAIGTSALFGC